MNSRKMKLKYFFSGIATTLLLIIVLFFLVFEKAAPDDPFTGVKPDYGSSLFKSFGQATLLQNEIKLGTTDFIASATQVEYAENNNWNFYTVSVEKRVGDSSYVFFRRHYKLREIPKDIIGKKANEIVKFNLETNEVTFDLESQIIKYKIPQKAL